FPCVPFGHHLGAAGVGGDGNPVAASPAAPARSALFVMGPRQERVAPGPKRCRSAPVVPERAFRATGSGLAGHRPGPGLWRSCLRAAYSRWQNDLDPRIETWEAYTPAARRRVLSDLGMPERALAE